MYMCVLLCKLIFTSQYDEKAEREHERQKKKAALKLIEYQLSPTEKQQSDSLFSALITTIVDNIQVQFKRVIFYLHFLTLRFTFGINLM